MLSSKLNNCVNLQLDLRMEVKQKMARQKDEMSFTDKICKKNIFTEGACYFWTVSDLSTNLGHPCTIDETIVLKWRNVYKWFIARYNQSGDTESPCYWSLRIVTESISRYHPINRALSVASLCVSVHRPSLWCLLVLVLLIYIWSKFCKMYFWMRKPIFSI